MSKPQIFYFSFLSLFIVFSQSVAFTQENPQKESFFSIGLSYYEIKDDLNHGFVFKGPDLSVEYGIQKKNDNRFWSYAMQLAGGGKTAIDSWGFRWLLSPINAHYSFQVIDSPKFDFYIGPSFQVNYNVFNYPELHAGPIIWLTTYDLGTQFSGFLKVKGQLIEVKLRSTLVAASSRPVEERDPYYFSTKIGENFSDMHSNMVYGTVEKFHQSDISISLFLNSEKRSKALTYVFQSMDYNDRPTFKQINHALKFTWYFKK